MRVPTIDDARGELHLTARLVFARPIDATPNLASTVILCEEPPDLFDFRAREGVAHRPSS